MSTKRSLYIDFFFKNSIILLIISYILILIGILPKKEIINTGYSIIFLSLAFCSYLIETKVIRMFNKEALLIYIILMVTIANVVFIENTENFVYNLNSLYISVSFVLIMSKTKYINPKTIENILKDIVFVGIISSIINLCLNYNSILNFHLANSAYDINFTGIFLGRNQQGVYLFLSLVSWHILRTVYGKRTGFGIPLLLMVNTVLSFSRASILATFLYFFCYYVNKKI